MLFRLPGRDVTAGRFAADALRLAAALPAASHAVNLCTGRYAFAVAFAAALLRGQPSLLTSDRSPHRLAALAVQFPGAVALTDTDVPCPMPWTRVPPPGGGGKRRARWSMRAQLAAIVFTSGSTGEPVPHSKTWGALAARSRDAGLAFAFDAGAPCTVVGTVPPQHMYGFETTGPVAASRRHPPYGAGRRSIRPTCGPRCRPVPPARILVTTPLQLRALLADATELPALLRIISATAPLDPAMAEAAERLWGTQLCEIFGATEVGSIASRRTVAGPEWTPYPSVRLADAGGGRCWSRRRRRRTRVLDDAVDHLPGGRFRLIGRRSDVVKLGGRPRLARRVEPCAGGGGGRAGWRVRAPGGRRPSGAGAHDGAGGGAGCDVRRPSSPPCADGSIRCSCPAASSHVDCLPRNELGKLAASALRELAS